MISRYRSDFWCFHPDVLRFVLVFWLRSVGVFRSPVNWSRKRAAARNTHGASHSSSPRRSSATKSPDHTTSFHFKRRKRSGTLARAGASGSPVCCVGLARHFIVIWFDHTQPSPLL